MSSLIIDIETIGEDFDSLDDTTKEFLTRWIKREATDEKEYQAEVENMKNGLGFSPLTGEIVVIGVLDYEKNKGAVYFQAPGEKVELFEEDGIKFVPATEKEMLEKFWQGAVKYNEFITFNGKSFDIPFLMTRSAMHKIKSTKNLMSNRYLGSQREGAKHVDLLDELTFYGAVRRKGNLHLWSRAFSIESPKTGGVTGDDVSRLFKDKKFIEIAKYNARDLVATRKLYECWNNYMRL